MSTDLPFGTQLLGQVEKTLTAILRRLLAGSGIDEPQWVTLNVVLAAGEPLVPADAPRRVAAALKVDVDTASTCLETLQTRGLLATVGQGAGEVKVSESGRAFHAAVRAQVNELTGRLWDDVPAEDLTVAADVLNTVLLRAGSELARLSD